jgi:hypothetical protein
MCQMYHVALQGENSDSGDKSVFNDMIDYFWKKKSNLMNKLTEALGLQCIDFWPWQSDYSFEPVVPQLPTKLSIKWREYYIQLSRKWTIL